jgi:hypothetical protein
VTGWNDLMVWCVTLRPSAEALDGRVSGQCLVPEPPNKAAISSLLATRWSLVVAPSARAQGRIEVRQGRPRGD